MTGWKKVARMPVEALQLLQKEKGDVEEEKKKTKKDKKEKEQQQKEQQQKEQQQEEEQQEEEEEHAGQTGQYRGVSENDRHEILEVKCHSNKRCDWDV
jgi:hypothetical protein